MQFIVTAYDFEDEDTINRRFNNREVHLAGLKKMANQGTFLSGGAILNSSGKMIGSSAHVEFMDKSELEAWIKKDVYTTGRVWEKVEISEALLFPVNK